MQRSTRSGPVFNVTPHKNIGALDLERWREWDGKDCGFFMTHYMNMPSYRVTAERNLTGEVLGKLYDMDCILVGLLRLGVTSYSDQKEIADAIRLLARRIFTARSTILPDIRKPKSRPVRLPTLSRTPFFPGQEKPKKKKPSSCLEAKMAHSFSLPTVKRNASVPSISPFGCADATTPVAEARTLAKSISDRKLVATQHEYLVMVKDVEFQRKAMLGKRRVDQMIESIYAEKKVVDAIVCQLPFWLRDTFMDVEFAKLATVKFAQLDDDNSGQLEPKELFPIIQSLAPENVSEISEEHCYKMATIFDTDKNGTISLDEFVDFLKFVITVNYLETEGQYGQELAEEGVAQTLTEGVKEYDELQRSRALVTTVDEFLALLEDTDQTPTVEVIRSYAPDGLVFDADFERQCMAMYDELRLGELACRGLRTPARDELRCILGYLSRVQPSFIRGHMVDKFENLFKLVARDDVSGGISEETFIKVCIFFTIMHHKSATDTRERVKLGILRIDEVLDNLESSVDQIFAMIPSLPADLRTSLSDANFARDARLKFNELDLNQNGVLSADELQPLLVKMLSGIGDASLNWLSVQESHCARFIKLFGRGGKELSVDDFSDFLRFTSTVSYLEMQSSRESTMRSREMREHPLARLPTLDAFEEEFSVTDKKIMTLFRSLKDTNETRAPSWNELPEDFQHSVANEAAFQAVCGDAFSSVDPEGVGELEPVKLLAVLHALVAKHGWKITETQFTKVGELFETHIRRVVRKDEFPDFVKFCAVLEQLEAEAAQKSSAASEARLVSFVRLIQQDYALLWDPSKAKQDSRDNFIPINTRLSQKWVDYFIGVEHVTYLHELYAFIDTNDDGRIDSNEVMPILARMVKQEATQPTISLGVPVIQLFDADRDGAWTRAEFGEFLKFLFLMLILESEARDVEIIEPKRLFEALFKPTWFSQEKDQLRLYPNSLLRIQKEKRRLLDIWVAGMGEQHVQACIKLQSYERMRVVRRQFQRRTTARRRASVKIQAIVKGRHTRKMALRRHNATIAASRVQAAFRGFIVRRRCAEEKRAKDAHKGQEPEDPATTSNAVPETSVTVDSSNDTAGTVANEASVPATEAGPTASVGEEVARDTAAEDKEAAPTPEATEATSRAVAEEKDAAEAPKDTSEAASAPVEDKEVAEVPADAANVASVEVEEKEVAEALADAAEGPAAPAEAGTAPSEEKCTTQAPVNPAEAAPEPAEKDMAEALANVVEVALAPEEKEAAEAPADSADAAPEPEEKEMVEAPPDLAEAVPELE